MKEITTEGMTYHYFTGSKSLPETLLRQDHVNDKALLKNWDAYLSSYVEEIRLALFPSAIVPENLNLYFLYWLDESNLKDIDKKVIENTYTDDMFVQSVATVGSRLQCRKCRWEGQGLVIIHSDVYLGFQDLEARKLATASTKGIKRCPVCDDSLRQTVVKIFQ